MSAAAKAIYGVSFVAVCVSLLGGIIWSWVRWARAKQPRTVFSLLSLGGLTLATAAALLAVAPLFVPGSFGVTQGLTPDVSLAGLLFAVGGALRSNPLRWHALGSAAAMFAFSVLVLVSG